MTHQQSIELTATQRLKLHDLYTRYMVNECTSTGWDVDLVSKMFGEFCAYTKELGISTDEGAAIASEVNQTFHTTWMNALIEGGVKADKEAVQYSRYAYAEAMKENTQAWWKGNSHAR